MCNDDVPLRDPTALLVLRVWMERGSALPLRAYIRQTADISHGFDEASTKTDIESSVASVRTWLEALLDAGSAGDTPEVPPNNPSNVHGLATEGPGDGPDGNSLASTNGVGPGP